MLNECGQNKTKFQHIEGCSWMKAVFQNIERCSWITSFVLVHEVFDLVVLSGFKNY